MTKLSPRLAEILEALPLAPEMRILEIGCGPGALARAIAGRLAGGKILAIDRSAKAIRQAEAQDNPACLSFRQVAIEDFELAAGQERFDLAIAVRVGALDGRHQADGDKSMARIAAALKPNGRLFVDGREVQLLR